jgi:hypothetical protein
MSVQDNLNDCISEVSRLEELVTALGIELYKVGGQINIKEKIVHHHIVMEPMWHCPNPECNHVSRGATPKLCPSCKYDLRFCPKCNMEIIT